MYLDFKVIIWERTFVPDELKEDVLRLLKDGRIQTANDALNAFENEANIVYEGSILETENQLTPEENDGFSTIELLTDDGEKPLFKNGK